MVSEKPIYKRGFVNEAVIQAELYTACKEAGIFCDLQYSIKAEKHQRDMPDLVVVEGYQVIAIVEVKGYTYFKKLGSISEHQIKSYKQHNVPVFILYSVYDIPYLVTELLEIQSKFLKSIDSTIVECCEADRQREQKWDDKIAEAFGRFDEVFPDYKFGNHSLELLVDGVKVLGLLNLLKQMTLYANVEDFFFGLNNLVTYTKSGSLRFLNERKGTIHTVLGYQNRQDRIDEKLS